jgi:uncharacterized membrane protein
MKNVFILFVSITLIFVFLGLIGAYYKENIFNLVKMSRTSISDFSISPNIQLLLYLSVIGLIGVFRSRS